MTWFSLPAVSTERPPAFTDMASCTEWLASQPLANAPLMQGVFADQLERLNAWALPARERFKVLETLRKAVFAIENDSVKRYEYRPLPLSPTEQKSLTASCHNWHGMAVGYLICLHACLARDEGLLAHSAKIAHRALTSLRLEQMARYRGGSAVPADFGTSCMPCWPRLSNWRSLTSSSATASSLKLVSRPWQHSMPTPCCFTSAVLTSYPAAS